VIITFLTRRKPLKSFTVFNPQHHFFRVDDEANFLFTKRKGVCLVCFLKKQLKIGVVIKVQLPGNFLDRMISMELQSFVSVLGATLSRRKQTDALARA
jgi:hypothetical protein